MKMACWLVFLLCVSALCAADDSNLFSYDSTQPLNVQERSSEQHGAVAVHDITFSGTTGQSMRAHLVVPQGPGPFAGILYVHWLGDPATSNSSQFLHEAEELAPRGAISLLVNMPWSDAHWFHSRKLSDDYDFSIRQVQDLRRALDVLSERKDVDPKRIAYVGHDFGATYGAMLLGVDSRVRDAVLMAGTPILSDWLLLGSKLQGEDLAAYRKKIAPLDPINFVGRAKSVPVLLQFATHDEYVPKAKAELFAGSVSEPKELRWYETSHAMNAAAAADRIQWLETSLQLSRK